MTAKTRASSTAVTILAVAFLTWAWLIPAATAGAEVATPIAYQPESLAEYEQQLAAGQIQSVTINKKLRSVRVTLKDGRHLLAKYKPKQEPKVAAALAAKHVPVIVLTPTEAAKEVHKPAVHHKLRYIVGGAVIVVIAIVIAVLVFDRKRKAAREE